MTQLLVDRSDIDFVIWEQFDGEAWIQKGGYEGFGRNAGKMIQLFRTPEQKATYVNNMVSRIAVTQPSRLPMKLLVDKNWHMILENQ
ncbi:MAG: acyl-CoA dehydrogenase N-terminal domain-containing protein [Deltaproteobacteria bacterium]|nr:acyl-CoA dehydrogenase N-terminal domain-containing protein [Deltaproteobacteria bacterium]